MSSIKKTSPAGGENEQMQENESVGTMTDTAGSSDKFWAQIARGYVIPVAVGVIAVAAAPIVLTAVGFTSAGIASGSAAAALMSTSAVANGGGVAAGGLVATLQSAGVVGLGAKAMAVVGGAIAWLTKFVLGKHSNE